MGRWTDFLLKALGVSILLNKYIYIINIICE